MTTATSSTTYNNQISTINAHYDSNMHGHDHHDFYNDQSNSNSNTDDNKKE